MSDFDYASQATRHVQRCNLCGEMGLPIAIPERFGFAAGTLACYGCGLVWLSPQMSADSYAKFYADGTYRRLVHERVKDSTPEKMEVSQRVYTEIVTNFLTPYRACLKGKSLIDIGGSTGIVAASVASEYEMSPTVLEPSIAEGEQARDRGCEWIQGTLETIGKDQKFDAAFVCQTVEHLMDISGGLENIASLLNPGGILLIDIVDCSHQWQTFRPQVKIDHLWYLTPHTMRAYLMRAGFVSIHEGDIASKRHVVFLCTLGERYAFVPDGVMVRQFLRLARGGI